MARLQILELPKGSSDDRPPFALVVDRYQPLRYVQGVGEEPKTVDEFAGVAELIGARTVLVFQETVEIPANNLSSDAEEIEVGEADFIELASTLRRALGIDMTEVGVEPDIAGWLLKACRELEKSEAARAHVRHERAEARKWARHGYEIGQRHCSWTDYGVAPAWLTEGWPRSFDSCEHLQLAAMYDEALTRVRNLSTTPEIMNAQQEHPNVWKHGYECGVRAAKSAARPRDEKASDS